MFAILHALWMFVVGLFKSRSRLEAEGSARAPVKMAPTGCKCVITNNSNLPVELIEMELWFRSRLSRYRRIHNRIIADVMQLTVFEYEHHIASLSIENFYFTA